MSSHRKDQVILRYLFYLQRDYCQHQRQFLFHFPSHCSSSSDIFTLSDLSEPLPPLAKVDQNFSVTTRSHSEPLPYSYGHSRLILDHPDARDSRPTSRVTQAKSTNSVAGRTSKDSERAKSQQKGTDRASWNITPPEEDNCSDANNHLHLPPEVRNHIYKHLRFGLSVLLASKQTYRKASLFSTPRTH